MNKQFFIAILILLVSFIQIKAQDQAFIFKINPVGMVDIFSQRAEVGLESRNHLGDRIGIQFNGAYIFNENYILDLSNENNSAKGFKGDLAFKYYMPDRKTHLGFRSMYKRTMFIQQTQINQTGFFQIEDNKVYRSVNTFDFVFGHEVRFNDYLAIDLYSGLGLRNARMKNREQSSFGVIEQPENVTIPNLLLGFTMNFNVNKIIRK